MAFFPDGSPCWVDVGLPDAEAGKHFYGELLDWTFEDTGPETGHYTLALSDGQPVAAIVPETSGRPSAVWTVYLAVPDVGAAAERVRAAGGRVTVQPTALGELGKLAVVRDPCGVAFGLWEGGELPGFGKRDAPSSFTWSELHTRDSSVVDSFYKGVFGYDAQPTIGPTGSFDYEAWYARGSEDGASIGRLQMPADAPAGLPTQFLVYFSVESCDAAERTIRDRLGGRIHFVAHDGPLGRTLKVADGQGAAFALISTTSLSVGRQMSSAR
ncbi:VOC family protein [Streptomyces sp. M41]|uniref:VOC family protein n=1 Tax=Streptomyces sp. M41 TaxID=3059412 RepID=UPI00374D2146